MSSNQKLFYHRESSWDANRRKAIARGADVIPSHESPFRATLTLFRNSINYIEPLSFQEWLAIADDLKAAVLYVQFYDQISLAWYKLKTDAAIEEECVEEVIQYLMKNVPIIAAKESKFSPRYIYRVCYNCIFCKSIDPYKGQTAKNSWYNNTSSPYIQCGVDTFVVFDYTPDHRSSNTGESLDRRDFWAIIEDMGTDTLSVVSKLLGDGFIPDHRVPKAKQLAIIEQLRDRLEPFKDIYYI